MMKKQIYEKVLCGIKRNSTVHLKMETPLFEQMKKAIDKLNATGVVEVNMQAFIRTAIRSYSQQVISAENIGLAFSSK